MSIDTANFIPHQSVEMEQATLGSMLIQPEAIETASGVVRSADFYREAHRIIFEAILTLSKRNDPVDILTVQEELRNREVLESVGGANYLVQLMNSVVTPSNVGHYAGIVSQKAVLRRLHDAGKRIAALTYQEIEKVENVVAEAERIFTGSVQEYGGKEPRHMREIVSDVFEQIEEWSDHKRHIIGIPTGVSELDFLTRGLQPRKLYVIAARPGMGKSALAGQIAVHASKQGTKALFCSLEMGDEELVLRAIATEANIDATSLQSGYLTDEDWRRVGSASSSLSSCDVWIDDEADTSLDRIRMLTRRYVRKGVGLLVVDYLQLIKGEMAASDSRAREIDEVAGGLKGIAKSLNIPVIALAQLNRKVDDRTDHRPILGDLRESGGIEASADVVIFPYNPAHYGNPADRKDFEPVEIIVAKARGGKLGVARAGWKCRTTEFVNLAKEYGTPQPSAVATSTAQPVRRTAGTSVPEPMNDWADSYEEARG